MIYLASCTICIFVISCSWPQRCLSHDRVLIDLKKISSINTVRSIIISIITQKEPTIGNITPHVSIKPVTNVSLTGGVITNISCYPKCVFVFGI